MIDCKPAPFPREMLRSCLICVLLLSAVPAQSRVHRAIGEIDFTDDGEQNYLRDTDFRYRGRHRVSQASQELDLVRGRPSGGADGHMENDARSVELNNENATSRRFVGWFTQWFRTTAPEVYRTIATTTESTYESDLKTRIFIKELHRNLTDVLSKLSDVEERVSELMQLRESYAIVAGGKPQRSVEKNAHRGVRSKRDIDVNEQRNRANKSTDDNNSNVTDNNVNNSTSTDCPCGNINSTSGRRSLSIYSPSVIKRKLLTYLDESFLDIKNKIKSLKSLKNDFSDDYSFRIGYILANIDTLETNLSNMKSNTDRNKEFWEDKKILELYDTLKVSDQAVSGLMESLKMYMGQLATSKSHTNTVNNLFPYMRPADIKG